MKGRLLAKVNVADATKSGKHPVSLPLNMSSGIYVVKFKSKDAVRQRVVSLL
jgi:phosphate starvation-inducible protein PhoH